LAEAEANEISWLLTLQAAPHTKTNKKKPGQRGYLIFFKKNKAFLMLGENILHLNYSLNFNHLW